MTSDEHDIVTRDARLRYLTSRRRWFKWRQVERLTDLAMYTAVTAVAVTGGHDVAWAVALGVFAVAIPVNWFAYKRAGRADDAADAAAREGLA